MKTAWAESNREIDFFPPDRWHSSLWMTWSFLPSAGCCALFAPYGLSGIPVLDPFPRKYQPRPESLNPLQPVSQGSEAGIKRFPAIQVNPQCPRHRYDCTTPYGHHYVRQPQIFQIFFGIAGTRCPFRLRTYSPILVIGPKYAEFAPESWNLRWNSLRSKANAPIGGQTRIR